METKNNPMGYAPPQPLKLPLAPMLSAPPDIYRRPNAVRRGSSIFSPAHHPLTLDRHPPPPPAPDPDPTTPKSKTPPPEIPTSAKYRECLKNHAATMGAHVVDGCGEFMPAEEDSLRCAACHCHRNFHRREPDENSRPPAPRFASGMVSFGGGAAAESSSGRAVGAESKKRFRTKFGPEQKERMQEFAAKVGWRMRKEEEEEVRRFCGEVGVKREVFKVWMHNNKQAMKRKRLEGSD